MTNPDKIGFILAFAFGAFLVLAGVAMVLAEAGA